MANPEAPSEAGLDVQERGGSVSVRVRVQPRAGRDLVGGVRAGALLVRLAAPPVEGQANDALVRLLARALQVPPSSVAIERGGRGRDKLVRIEGVTKGAVRALAGAR